MVDVAMLARLSPAMTVWLDMILQSVPIVLFAARIGVRRAAVERRSWKCIVARL